MARSPLRPYGPGNKPRWFTTLMRGLDPDRSARALIRESEERYAQRRTSDDAGPPPNPEG